MTEQRTITVTAYRTPDGKPTCAADYVSGEVCRFATSRRVGQVEVCGFVGCDIRRADQGYGYTIPVDGCPVWAEVQS